MEHLIPSEWFVDLPQIALILIGAVSMFAVIKGADWLVEGASGIAMRLGMSKVIIGATIVSLGTTSPECAVSVMAAFQGEPDLALGNAVGSIIADTGLIFGLGCMLAALPVDKFILNRQGWVQFGAGLLLAAICFVQWMIYGDAAAIPRWAGIGLLVLLVWYIWASIGWGRRHAELVARAHDEPDEVIEHAAHRSVGLLGVFFVAGLVLVIVGGHVLIECVKVLAERWGVPEGVVASTIVAFGTSLPELVVGMTAIRKGHAGLLIGNVIGADILNVLFVVGAAATASSLPIIDPEAALPSYFLLIHLPVMLLILGLFRVFIADAIKRGSFARWNGVPLLLVYLAYLVLNFVVAK